MGFSNTIGLADADADAYVTEQIFVMLNTVQWHLWYIQQMTCLHNNSFAVECCCPCHIILVLPVVVLITSSWSSLSLSLWHHPHCVTSSWSSPLLSSSCCPGCWNSDQTILMDIGTWASAWLSYLISLIIMVILITNLLIHTDRILVYSI